MVFDRKWFKEHQEVLLFLCNNFILKYWFRWILRIHKDISFKTKIYKLEPNAFTWQTGKENEYSTDFRTKAKFSNRLFYAFKPLWYTLHYFDNLFIYYGLELSFGFDTLTVYPDAHTETTSCDGQTSRNADGVWSAIRGGNGDSYSDDGYDANAWLLCGYSAGVWDMISRILLFYDTSSLDDSANISAATLSVGGYTKMNTLSWADYALNVYGTNSTNTTGLSNSDYQSCLSSAFATAITYAGFTISGYNNFTLNASGLSNISKTGLSRFSLRSTYDADNTEPTFGNGEVGRFRIETAELATNAPKLVVTYTLGSSFLPKTNIIN